MKLFHGTNASRVPAILEHGLRSRGRRRGNWKDFPSRHDMVYLTEAYACYYGFQAADKDEGVAVFEIDLDRLDHSLLYPDEDFIAQVLAHQRGESLEKVHREVRRRLAGYQHHWRDSLKGLGNVCYRGLIPASAITRYAVLGSDSCFQFRIAACDPSISLMNYRFCSDKYRSMMQWLFGDSPEWLMGYTGMSNKEFCDMHVQWGHPRPNLDAVFRNRVGIEVVTL